MSDHHWSWTAETRLSSRPSAHVPHMEEIVRKLEGLGWAGRDLFGVRLALEESLSNAIRHGNRLDDSKQVFVQCKLSPDRFWLSVRDEGAGFRPKDVPDCTNDANLECCGGRGLALIMAYMTRVEYNERGNCVTMEKIRSADGAAPPKCRPCEPDDSRPE